MKFSYVIYLFILIIYTFIICFYNSHVCLHIQFTSKYVEIIENLCDVKDNDQRPVQRGFDSRGFRRKFRVNPGTGLYMWMSMYI